MQASSVGGSIWIRSEGPGPQPQVWDIGALQIHGHPANGLLANLGKQMKLIEAIGDLGSLDDGRTIYAAEPWTPDSPAVVLPEPDAKGGQVEAHGLKMRYFLEVVIARDILEGWAVNPEREPTLREKCNRLILYAITDA